MPINKALKCEIVPRYMRVADRYGPGHDGRRQRGAGNPADLRPGQATVLATQLGIRFGRGRRRRLSGDRGPS